MKYTP